ncbi:MAG: hypothetical protein JSS07_09165 [Proteobacteria bacterium]|nr:hypothetical protein [Pseudomonadota bacterium]
MKRSFVLVPNLRMAQEIVRELTQIGFEGAHIHVVGQRSDKIQKIHLHEANIIETSDLVPSLKRGCIIGFAFSVVLCGIYAYIVTTNSLKINPYIIFAILLFGTIFGAWVSSLIGVSVEDPTLQRFEEYIKTGHYILIFEQATDSDIAIIENLLKHHPGANLALNPPD